ncbi:MAG: PilN domain-containing protein [Planctomycetales bacterium]|nr:PilN domain-containing protein [Planctomycetales bacterium]
MTRRLLTRALGVDLGPGVVRVAEVVREGDRVEVRRVVEVPPPPAAEAGAVSPSPPTAEERGKALRAALDAAGVAPAPAVASLPRGSALVRRVPVPPSAGEELVSLLDFQARKEFPLPLGDLAASYLLDALGTAATLAATRRETLADVRRMFEAAEIPLASVTIPVLGAIAAFRHALGEGDEAALLVDVEAPSAEIALVAGPGLRLARTAPLPSEPDRRASELAAEVGRVLRAASAEPGAPAPARVLLLGSGAPAGGLAEAIGSRTGLPVAALSTLDGALRPVAAPGEDSLAALADPGRGPDAALLPAGLALTALLPDVPCLDLLEPTLGRPRKPRRRRGRTALVVAGIVGAAAALWLPQRHVAVLEAQAAARERDAKALEDGDGKLVAKLRSRLGRLSDWTENRERWIEVLKALAECVPDGKDVYVTSLVLKERSPITIQGRAKGESAVFAFLDALEKHPLFAEAATRDRHDAKRKDSHPWDFLIEARVVPGATP